MKHTLQDILDRPSRMKNIDDDVFFQYAIDAAENEDDFRKFIGYVYQNRIDIFTGLMIMYSDILRTDIWYKEQLQSAKSITDMRGSQSSMSIFKMLENNLEANLLNNDKVKDKLFAQAELTLPAYSHRFFLGVFNKTVNEKVAAAFRHRFDIAEMSYVEKKYFSYAYDVKFINKDVPSIQTAYLCKSYSVLYKHGNSFITEKGDIVNCQYDERATRIAFANVDDKCLKLYKNDANDKIFIASNFEKSVMTCIAEDVSTRLTDVIAAGNSLFVADTAKNVIGKANITEEELTIKSFVIMQLPVLGMSIRMMQCKTDAADVTVLLPTSVTEIAKNKKKIKVFCHNGNFYLKSE